MKHGKLRQLWFLALVSGLCGGLTSGQDLDDVEASISNTARKGVMKTTTEAAGARSESAARKVLAPIQMPVTGLEADACLALARAYADTMIEKGRDRYGEKQSPLFAAALDIKTLSLPADAPPNAGGLRGIERSWRGANPMHDQSLYQTLYALTEATGDKRYAEQADAVLKWFFENCQSPETGLMAWGEHLQWDFRAERCVNAEMKKHWELHEFCRPWVLWNRCYGLAPDPCLRFAKGLWAHQIADQKTGAFSRHAGYYSHKVETKWEFPRHGGFYIATWAAAYERTKDPEFVQAVNVLVDAFLAHRHPVTGVIPAAFDWKICWTASNLSLAIDLWDAAPRMPVDVAKKMTETATQIDDVYLKTPHDLGPNGKGFLITCLCETLAATTPSEWSQPWSSFSDARHASLCALRYRQTKRDEYRQLVLAAAQRYLAGDPPAGTALQPGTLADAMRLMRVAHTLEGNAAYLDRAKIFAALARDLFLKDSTLPRASSTAQHYEAITGGDALMMEYLALWCAVKRPDLADRLVFCDR